MTIPPTPTSATTAATATTPTTAPLEVAGVGEMPTPREIATIGAVTIWGLYTGLFGKSEAVLLWEIFFGFGMTLDLIDTAWRFHYRKQWADQILWWTQPHYIFAAILGLLIDWVFPINLTINFVATIILGVLLSIPVEKYYLTLKDSE
jgi:hypothetical protein